MRRIVMLALAMAGASCAVADTYRWVDPASGRTMVSDTLPPASARRVAKSAGGDAEGRLPYALRRAADAFPVTLYTASDCASECRDARELLKARGIPFTEKTLKTQEEMDELKQLVGDLFVPTLKVGKQVEKGYAAGAYDSLLDMAGYPRTAPYGSWAGQP